MAPITLPCSIRGPGRLVKALTQPPSGAVRRIVNAMFTDSPRVGSRRVTLPAPASAVRAQLMTLCTRIAAGGSAAPQRRRITQAIPGHRVGGAGGRGRSCWCLPEENSGSARFGQTRPASGRNLISQRRDSPFREIASSMCLGTSVGDWDGGSVIHFGGIRLGPRIGDQIPSAPAPPISR